MVYLSRFDFDLNDPTAFQLNPDICSITSTAPIPIMHNSTSPYQHHSKEIDIDYLNMNSNRMSFTDFLSTDMMDAYGMIHQATTCSSPESDNYMFMDDTKVKLEEYSEPLDASSIYNMSRTLSSESCPELANCNQTNSPLTPIDSPSPHDQSPIITPNCLPISHHHPQYHHQQIISEEVMIETPQTTATKRGRGRRAATATTAVMTNTTISGMQLQDAQEYQHSLMGSSSLPSPPPKTSGKSRGRRMTNKPAKPGTKSFECTYAGCGRVFKRSEHLKRHIRSIHTLERPFHCPHPHCSKRFSRSDNLSQHVRVHRPNGKEKNATSRSFSNFTPFLQTYPNGNIHSALQQPH